MAALDIVCTTDLSDAATEGIHEGIRLAADIGATVTVLFVVEEGVLAQLATNLMSETQQRALMEEATQEAQQALEAQCKDLVHGSVNPRPVVLQAPRVADAICDYAATRGTHMIAIATHGRGEVAHLLLGSVAERIVRLARCPVLVVRRRTRPD